MVDHLVKVSPRACGPWLSQTRALARELGVKTSEAHVESQMANCAWLANDLDAVEAHSRRALALARECGDGTCEASALSLLAILYRTRTDYERARECAELCRLVSERAGFAPGVLAALNTLGNMSMLQGRLEEALDCYQQCLEVNEELGDDLSGATFHVNIGLLQEQLGRWEDAAGNLYRAVAICERCGFAALCYTALNILGEMHLKRDKLDRAVETLELVAEAGRNKLTAPDVLRDALSNLGQAYGRRGDLACAGRTFAEGLELCRSAGDRREQAVLLWRSAEVALWRGSPARAKALADQSLALAQELGLQTQKGEALRVTGLIEARCGEAAAARQAFAAALEAFTGSDEGYEMARARCQYARFLQETGDTPAAVDLTRAAVKVFRRLATAAEAEEATELLFRLRLKTDRDSALLEAIAGLAALGLDPTRVVRRSLQLLGEGLGFDSGALLTESRTDVACGRPNLARGRELAARGRLVVTEHVLCFPVEHQGQAVGSVYLERHTPAMAAWDTVIAGAIGNLLAVAVKSLIRGRQETYGPEGLDWRGFAGAAPRVRAGLNQAAQLAGGRKPMLIWGEKGTGRKLLARAIHDSSEQCGRALVVLTCSNTDLPALAALLFGDEEVSSRLETGEWGTVVLEDAQTLSPELQARLWEWLVGPGTQAGAARMVAISKPDQVSNQTFDPRLLRLLAESELQIPPLRERVDDIPGLAGFLVRQRDIEFNRGVSGLSAEALELLQAYLWPGNVAEMEHVLERAVLLAQGPLVRPEDLPRHIQRTAQRA